MYFYTKPLIVSNIISECIKLLSSYNSVGVKMRGALIVLEGGDRSGKTTQCKKIVDLLDKQGVPVQFMTFPDRSTAIGKLIDNYLSKKEEIPDKAVHLLFTANRWEMASKIRNLLYNGTTIVVDRYSYSGVAFSAAKKGLDIDWCKQPEAGLPKPDLVLLLKLGLDVVNQRSGWGAERYENSSFQSLVAENYQRLKDLSYWKVIDANKDVETLTSELLPHIYNAVETAKTSPLLELW